MVLFQVGQRHRRFGVPPFLLYTRVVPPPHPLAGTPVHAGFGLYVCCLRHCRASNVHAKDCRFNFINAKDASYANAWRGTWAVVSVDREAWTRCPTTYDDKTGVLSISVKAGCADCVWLAYFAPFSHEQHQKLIASCQLARAHDGSRACTVTALGQSLEGRDIDVVTAGTGPLVCWILARQHPGESMAEWWMSGFLPRLLDCDDAVARKLLEAAYDCISPPLITSCCRRTCVFSSGERLWDR